MGHMAQGLPTLSSIFCDSHGEWLTDPQGGGATHSVNAIGKQMSDEWEGMDDIDA